MVTRVTLDLASDDEKAVIRLLKMLLKRLGRDYGVVCKGITTSDA